MPRYRCGHCAPVAIHASIKAANCACVPGAGVRPSPGRNAHAIAESVAMCSLSFASVRPPFRAGSWICRQISRIDFPCHAIDAGARPQAAFPGMLAMDSARVVTFDEPWHARHGKPGKPTPYRPPYISGTCGWRSSPCVAWRVAGWQFMQRGLVITLAASANNAADRTFASVMLANAESGFSGTTSAAPSEMAAAARHAIKRRVLIVVIGARPSCLDSISEERDRSAACGYVRQWRQRSRL